MNVVVPFTREEAVLLAAKASSLAGEAREIVAFSESEPDLAARAAVEVAALEAKAILRKGAVQRIMAAARYRNAEISREDLSDLSRLEAVTILSSDRIAGLDALMGDAESPVEKISGIVGLAATTVGLVNSLL
jgi:hypothetical protein